MLKRLIPAVLLLSGCGGPSAASPAPPPAPAAAPPAAVLPPDAAALVNGEIVSRDELQQLLMKRYGASALNELVLKKLVAQEARKAGIAPTEAEIQARFTEALAEIKKQVAAEVTLAQVLQAQGLTEAEFREQMVLRILLEKLTVRDALCGAWVRVRMLAAGTEEKAQALLVQLRGGADFAALAQKESMDGSAAHGGDLGPRFPGELPPELEATAFSIQVGALTDVIKTPLGFLIARVEERQEAKPRPYADIKTDIDQRLAKGPPDQDTLERYLGRLRRAAGVQVLPSLSPPAPVPLAVAPPPAPAAP